MSGFYVVERKSGEYVAQSGEPHSYTRNVERAEKFKTYDQADKAALEDEHAKYIGI